MIVYIIERAPVKFSALIKQRIRWFKGYYECLEASWKLKRELGYIKALKMAISYLGPIISIATTISYTVLFVYLFSGLLGITPVVIFIKSAISGVIYYLAAFMFFVGNLFFIVMITYYFNDTNFESYTPYIYIAFIYWYLIGIVALHSLFTQGVWYKTERILDEQALSNNEVTL